MGIITGKDGARVPRAIDDGSDGDSSARESGSPEKGAAIEAGMAGGIGWPCLGLDCGLLLELPCCAALLRAYSSIR